MNNAPLVRHVGCFALIFSLCLAHIQTIASELFPLSIQATTPGSARLSWPKTAGNAALESSDRLVGSPWTRVTSLPDTAGDTYSVTVQADQTTRFFRLGPAPVSKLTTLIGTSPLSGETGVAVTRETVLHFSGPLSPNASLGTSNLFAGFGGRRILSRVELSSDRTKATLFYLEPLPGSARVVVVLDGSSIRDANGSLVDADGDGTPGGQGIITFDTLSLTTLPNTAVIGTVYASELAPGSDTGTNAVNKPLAGVTVTVDGLEQTLRTVTDASGNFKLSPVPPGRFFVHIDGRTVNNPAANIHYPDKAYYPFVGKAWDAVAGREDNLAGGTGKIYLPLITAGTLQPVSLTNDTVITFPASVLSNNPTLSGVSITVPANSLFSENGSRGGKVGIAPVPPDRLPGPLPPGLELPIVITVQSDGALNFDRPAPICFPNLPDPVLKTPLPANSRQALLAFNHDKGIWEASGLMTVSSDGKFICSDPGSGVLQPGWYGVCDLPDEPPPGVPPVCLGEESRQRCILRASILRGNCLDGSIEIFEKLMDLCLPVFNQECTFEGAPIPCPPPPDVANCQFQAATQLTKMRKQCEAAYNDRLNRCNRCTLPKDETPGSKQPFLERQASPHRTLSAAVTDQLRNLSAQVFSLLEPFSATRSEIPPPIQTQISNLRREMSTLAGGDTAGYFKELLIAAEQEDRAFAHANGVEPEDLETSNAPAYPVLYVATVLRPSGRFQLRGETAPFGHYSLFVPRDGILLEVTFYDPRTKQFGIVTPHRDPAARYSLPRFTLSPLSADESDFDQDGLPDMVEDVFGTEVTVSDSDGDGILDGAEIDQGTNPLDGVPVRTGIVGTVKTPGAAFDVAAVGDLLAVAEGTTGVAIFNLSNGMTPVLLSQVDTPGNAQAVGISGNFVAVADGDYGLAVIDVSQPAQARIVHQTPLAGSAQAVAVRGNVACLAVFGPAFDDLPCYLTTVDLVSGLPIHQILVGQRVRSIDLAVAGDRIYLLTDSTLFIYTENDLGLQLLGQLSISGEPGQKLFAGGGLAYVGNMNAYYVIDVNDPAKPAIIGQSSSPQLGLHDIITTGSGRLLGTGSVAGPARFQVALYDSSTPTSVTNFLTLFDTPGDAQSFTIHNGLAYIADGSAGIQVLNYQPFDKNGQAPSITLTVSGADGGVETSRPLRVTAHATDDVQVRNVELYIDGQKVLTDGNFPFEFVFDAPALSANKTNFTLRARAVDTGGNATWSDEIKIALGTDVTPPRIVTSAPLGGAPDVASLQVFFNEPIAAASVNPASFQLLSAGPDGLLDTGDDVPISGAVQYHAPNRSASLELSAPLPQGMYRALLTSNVADVAGNRMAANYSWQFRVANGVFWSRATGGFWEDDANWSTGRIPGPDDDIYIESIPGHITIAHRGGVRTIKKLIVGERVVLDGGATWQISDTLELHDQLVLDGATLKGGVVRQIGAGALFASTDGRNTLDGVAVVGDLRLTNHIARLIIRNGLSLTGTLFLDDLGYITFTGDQTFDHAQVVFGNSGQFQLAPGTTLTLGPQMLLRGKSGQIGQGDFGTKKLINYGRIAADVAGGIFNLTATHFENHGTVECANGGKLTFIDQLILNTGRMNALSGGEFTLSGTWTNRGILALHEAKLNLGGTFDLANLGTIERTGGTLYLTGLINLGGSILTLDASTGPWALQGGTFKGGTVRQTADAQLQFPFGATFDAMRVEGDLLLANPSARVLIRHGLDVTGTILLENSGRITFAGEQTFDGKISFTGNSAILSIEPGTTLTLGPSAIVRAKSGSISGDFGTKKLINQGLISVDGAGPSGPLILQPTQFENQGTLECKNGGAITILEGDSRNTGEMNVTSGATLTLNGTWHNLGTINATDATLNLGGTFSLSDLGTIHRTGGTVRFNGALDLAGGTLTMDSVTGLWEMENGTFKGGTVKQTSEGGMLFPARTRSTFENMRVEGDLLLTNLFSGVLIKSNLVLLGSAILDNAGHIDFVGDQTFDGQIVFTGSSGILGIEPGTTLTLGPSAIVRGKTGSIGTGPFGVRKLINQGLISADVPSGSLTISPEQFENTGTLRADGPGATLTIRANPFTNTGTTTELNGGKVLVNP